MLDLKSQDFGSDPVKKRDSDNYVKEYITGFADKWDELIDWKSRAENEDQFFTKILRKHGAKKVLDASCGTGFNSVQLIKDGFDVTSLDGSPAMLARAFNNAKKENIILRTINSDWRWITKDIVHNRYDAVICLGNSFTHLFKDRDRRKVLAEFYSVLKNDGILIIDQRNYDTMLDEGFSSKHKYYYAGNKVKAEPEYLDEGLARFRYEFQGGEVYHLNMCPLRKDYTKHLLKDAGYQRITTFGDFRRDFDISDADFLVHVAEKEYMEQSYTGSNRVARDYYNSHDADEFYYHVWGGEDIHIGIYHDADESISDASRRTVEKMSSMVDINEKTKILDIGAGYGGAARQLASKHGCRVCCVNISEVENKRNREKNMQRGLDHLIEVCDGTFDDIPYEDDSFDLVWSEDAILHSDQKQQVFHEVERVLRKGGSFIFTDPMQKDGVDTEELQPILDRINLDEMGSVNKYKNMAKEAGLKEVDIVDLSDHLPVHYDRVRSVLEGDYQNITKISSRKYVDKMIKGLTHWVDGGNKGNLAWAIMLFEKK
ncbi:MAG: methyltransferase domain-containing protein [Desulfarculaceae bacterium]|nr:methyltransferase domain-containing protein [Desulfarculaceae bacterium]